MKHPTKLELAVEVAQLRTENEELRKIVVDLHWMARRYADGRQSYAVGMFNDHTRKLLKLGVSLNPTGDNTLWARDGGGRAFDELTEEEADMGNPPDWTWGGVQRENERLRARIRELEEPDGGNSHG